MEPVLSHQEQTQQHQMLELVSNFHNVQMLTQIKQLATLDQTLASLIQQHLMGLQQHPAHHIHVPPKL